MCQGEQVAREEAARIAGVTRVKEIEGLGVTEATGTKEMYDAEETAKVKAVQDITNKARVKEV